MPIVLRIIESVVLGLERMVTVCFLALALLLVALVTLRYLFNTTIIGGDEIAGILFVYTTAFGAAVGVARNSHIRISVLRDALPALGRRTVDFVTMGLVLALHIGLLSLSTDWIAQTGGFETPVLNLPQGIGQVAIPAGCVLVAVFAAGRMAMAVLGPTTDEG